MTESPGKSGAPEVPDVASAGTPRMHLLWDVLLFQFKLAADGLRDVLLSPISIGSAIVGLIAGGAEPDRYFKQVLRLGRRSEIWINLFGYRKHGGTADEFIEPIKERLFAEAKASPFASKVGNGFNRTLDSVNASFTAKSSGTSERTEESGQPEKSEKS